MNFSCDTMTENQIFPMSADLFDTSSNSSNPLKYDLYSLGLSNSNSSNALFGSSAVHAFSPLHQLTINTSTPSPTTTPSITTITAENNIYNQHHNTNNIGGGGSSNSVSSNVMLTNAITIPRSNNPNQSHHNPYQDESRHHPSPSPLQHHLHLSHLSHNHHPQMMSSSSSSTHSNSHHYNNSNSHTNNGGSGGGGNSNSNAQNGQQQQQHQQQHHHQLSDINAYDALDALDASLSPTLMHDVSLSAASPLNSSLHSITPNGNVSTGFYAQDESPVSGGGNSGSNSVVGSINAGENSTLLSLSGTAGDDVNNSLIYEVHGGGATPNSNTMWSDIGSAIVTTKNEPFTLEDDIYIFPIDKTEIQSAGFDDNFLEDIGNIEDFLPSVATDGGHSGFLLSPQSNSSLQQLNSPQASPGGPPLELLQQQQQMQHQQQRHQQQQLTQLQTIQSPQSRGSGSGGLQHSNSGNGNGSSGGNGSNGGGGAMHHSHHNHHSSSSPYDIYHSTPNKQQQQQQHSSSNTAFSPGSQPSHSPLQQVNSITPPPPPHANRSQYSQQSSMVVKSRNMQELIKKGFSMSPDRNSNHSSALLGQSVPGGGSHMLISGNALSPGSGGSSGFGSTTTGSVRKSFGYQSGDTSSLSRLSSSAPTHVEHIWVRREPRQHLLSTGSLAEAESFSSLSTASMLSPDGIDFSQDDDEDGSTDYNSDHYDDFSSDNGSDNEDDPRTSTPSQLSSSKGKERYFWQYNVQAKGPKGKRLVFQSKLEDPHVLNEVTDPVFSPNCSVRGIKVFKHSGKARKGDGNDLTPNPRKLHSIGKELDKLSRTINDMTPVSELPFNVRPKSRKEKNKLASRACRLKKKAQHEANKIKLFGLEIEHKRLLNGIAELKQALAHKYHNQNVGELNEEVDQQIERIYKTASTGIRIAGGTTDFVNKVLDNIKSGVPNGGLEEIRNS